MLAYPSWATHSSENHRVRPFLSCLAPLVFTLALPAQSTVVTPWPGVAFQTAITGSFLGDYRVGALILRADGQIYDLFEVGRIPGGSPVVAIDESNAPVALTGVTGLVGYRPIGLTPEQGDVVLVATSSGAWRGSFEMQDGQWKLRCRAVLDATWYGANQLTTCKLPSGLIEIAARAAGSTYALIAVDDNGIMQSVESRHSVNTITGVHLIDWDHNGTTDLLVVTNAGMGMGVANGEVILDCGSNLSSARTLPIKFVGNDEIGIIWNGLAYPQQSLVYGSRSCLQLARVDLPTSGFNAVGQLTTGAATFDVTNDGTPEVLVSRVGDFKYLYLRSNGLYSTLNPVPTATGQPANNLCNFFWKDFDYDGRPDLLAFWNAGFVDGAGAMLKSIVFHSDMLPPGSGWTQPAGGGGGGGGSSNFVWGGPSSRRPRTTPHRRS